MRRVLLATAAIAVMTSPSLAQTMTYGGPPASDSFFYSNVVGGVELSLSRAFTDDDKDFNLFQGSARANVPIGDTWNILFETGGLAAFEDGDSESQIGATGHLWAGRGDLRYGVYAGVSYNRETFGRIGLEYEYDITNQITIGGQASIGFADPDCCVGDVTVYNLRGWMDYYFTDNTKLTGEIAYTNFDFDGGSEDSFSYSKRLTHRFDGTPFNVFGHANYTNFDNDDDVFIVGVGVGVAINDGGTQKSYDKSVPFEDAALRDFLSLAF